MANNTGLPSNLWAGGAVTFNTSPLVNLYANMRMKEQAKRDALDQYYSKMADDMLGQEEKMRPQDIEEGWQKKYNIWKSFGTDPENRKAILNPSKHGFDKLNTWEKLRQDLMSDAIKSKKINEDNKKVLEYKMSGKWQPTDEDINEINELNKSIYDPTRRVAVTTIDPTTKFPFTSYRSPDISFLSPNIPDPKPSELNQYYKSITGGLKPSDLPIGNAEDIGGYRRRQLYRVGYTPESLSVIGQNAGSSFDTNRQVRKLAESAFNQYLYLPESMQESINQKYKSIFGKDITSARDYWIINSINTVDNGKSYSKEYNDAAAKDQYVRQAIKDLAYGALTTKRRYKQLDQKTLDDLIGGITDAYVKDPSLIPQDILASYQKKDDFGHNVPFDAAQLSSDGKTIRLIKYSDPTSKTEDINRSSQIYVPELKQRIKNKLKTAETNTDNLPNNENNKPSKNTKQKTKAQIMIEAAQGKNK